MSGLRKLAGRAGLFAAVAAAATITAVAAIATAPVTAATAATTAAVTTAAAATTTATTTITTAAAATTTAFTEGAGRAFLARTGDVHREGAAFELVTVEFFHALLGGVGALHGDERKTAGTTGEFVEDDLNDADGADLAKQGFEILGGAGKGEVPHVELVVV